MLMILGNTIAMGVRERTSEYARAPRDRLPAVAHPVLRPRRGDGARHRRRRASASRIAYPFVNGLMGKAIEENMGRMVPLLPRRAAGGRRGGVIAIVLAATAALLPAIQAGRISVTDALRRVG